MLNKIILTNQLIYKFTIFAARKGGMDMCKIKSVLGNYKLIIF